MLRLSDSRNFSRTLAAIGLIVGPLLFLISDLIRPAWSDDSATFLQEVADDKGLHILAGALWTVGTLFFIAGALGLIKLLRGRGVTLGQIGAALLTVGLVAFTAVFAFTAADVELADAENREAMVALNDSLEDSAGLHVYFFGFFIGGIALGSLLLAIALLRRRIVPIWSPILLIASIVVAFLGEDRWISALSLLLLLVALAPLAMRILATSDHAWGRWEPLAEGPAQAQTEAGSVGHTEP